MLSSMTGFAALSGDTEEARWDWEIRGVNSRGLDVRVRLPDGMEALEPVVRAQAKAQLVRGNVTVSLRYVPKEQAGLVTAEPQGVEAAIKALAAIEVQARGAGLSLAPMTAADLATVPGVLRSATTARAQVPDELKAQIDELFDLFVDMRRSEGQALEEILTGQLAQVAELTAKGAQTAEARQSRAGDLLKVRVAALVAEAGTEADPERLQQELAILAVKADVTEEIDRLKAHVDAAGALLKAGGPVGRKLDFLMQEFNREANTLCSKSGSTELTQIGMDLKVLIDQMREQVQNLE